MTQGRPNNKRFLTITLVIIGLVLTIELTQLIGLRFAYKELNQQASHHLKNLVSYIENILGRFEKVPEVLSTHPLLTEVLINPQDLDKQDRLNQLLGELKEVTQASDIYLINHQGITVAASNYQDEKSFVGMDFSVRPYFKNAIKGKLSHYYAVGLSSDKRGYYYAFPVNQGAKTIGVIALKISIEDIEKQHKETLVAHEYNFLIVAPDDVVFISDKPKWRLKTIGDISAKKHQQLVSSKRYAGRDILPLDAKTIGSAYLPSKIAGTLVQINTDGVKENVYALDMHMKEANWRVNLWSSLEPIDKQKSMLTLLSICGYLLAVFLVLFGKERAKNSKNLRDTKRLLEKRVQERTVDLTASNQKLIEEIQQKELAQTELKNIQDELIQSAKLAVIGHMSASINHEINQPLTALRSYSQNALTYQERGMTDKVSNNLHLIIDLVDRLANIVSQFKSFSKKSTGITSLVNVQESLSAALSIVKHQALNESVSLVVDVPDTDLYIDGDGMRLEQVFVNLFTNAIQAMFDEMDKVIYIDLSTAQQQVFITIRDGGPGVLEDNIDKIFQPFFTTKDSYGLGLGLSISYKIIESMHGKLSVGNHADGGAVFTIELPISQSPISKSPQEDAHESN